MTIELTQSELEAYLGRSLTEAESANRALYLEIAQGRLEDLLCDKFTGSSLPKDLTLVFARIFGIIGTEQAQSIGVQSKKVEDFSITYGTENGSIYADLIQQNKATILKYTKCQPEIIHGRTIFEDAQNYLGDEVYFNDCL